MLGLYLFLTRTYIGTAIRAVSQDREAMALMGANPQRIYIVTSAVGGGIGRRGRRAADHPVLRAPVLRRRVRADHVHDLRARRPREHGRGVRGLVHHERDHLVGGVAWSTEMGYVIAFALFIVMMFTVRGGILAKRE
jgi:branched-chain amino acid transport system permease protein